MRTTVELDDDVARQIETLVEQERANKRTIINRLLRIGLSANRAAKPTTTYRTASADLGRSRIPNLDDVSEVLAVAENEAFG